MNCSDDRKVHCARPPLLSLAAASLEMKPLNTEGLSHPVKGLRGTPSNFPSQETTEA